MDTVPPKISKFGLGLTTGKIPVGYAFSPDQSYRTEALCLKNHLARNEMIDVGAVAGLNTKTVAYR